MGRKGSAAGGSSTVELSVKTEFDEALDMLQGLGADRNRMMRRLLSGIGTSAKAKVRRAYKTYGLNKDTGELYRSISRRVVRSGKGVIVEAKARTGGDGNVFYGYALAKGARITAKDGGYLTFRKDGKWVKVHEVKLPERDFVAKPVEDYLKTTEFRERLDSLVQKEIGKIEEKARK